MVDKVPNEFAGAFNPDGKTDFSSLADNLDDSVDNIPDPSLSIPTQAREAVDQPRKQPVGDVAATLLCLKNTAHNHGAIVTNDMESLFKYYCANEQLDIRDIEFFVRGYVYATGSQVGPKIQEATEGLKVEMRAIQRANATLAETIKLLANQAVSVEKEIAALSVNVKNDVTAALKSAVAGKAKLGDQPVSPLQTVKLPLAKASLEVVAAPNPVPATLEVGEPSKPSETGLSDPSQLKKMRSVLSMIGVEDAVLNNLLDNDIPVIYPAAIMEEYGNLLGDPEVCDLIKEEVMGNIEKFLLCGA
ncbi:phosphoprotein [Wuhan Insect virus 5]|uniref:Phosphoprotein n=1 Tax=Wuhan Insect virus 5 TaxID=1608110 RepID=A0A0B5KRP4_9RHAB|nr:phosphoprotein [Wuhan Insect virus 5]AJG39181.1 phosphoprotein [Wuhan Insect virus 5]